MKKGIIKKLFLTGTLFTVGAVALLYCFGDVAISEQPYVLAGTEDLETGRSYGGCESRGDDRDGLEALDPESIRVLSWNSHKGSHAAFGSDLKRLAKQTDFFLLQEAALDNRLKRQLKVLGRKWLMTVAFERDGTEFGILSASAVSAKSSCAFREPEPLLVIPKMILAATYPITGLDVDLLVVNVHMVNFTIGSEALVRQVNGVSKLIAGHRGPVIVAGDFNTWSDERESVVNDVLEKLKLMPVSFDPDNRSLFLNRTVDGIYYRGLKPTRVVSHVVETSDHNPLEVHFRLIPDDFSS